METPIPLLPYAEVRQVIRSGDLLLCSGSSAMSRMIQAATGSRFSHVAFIMRLDQLDRLLVLESVETRGIRAGTLRAYVEDYNGTGEPYPGTLTIARHLQMNLDESDHWRHVSTTAIDLLNYPYGTLDIMDITARIVGAKLGMAPRPPRTDRTYICSEYCQLILESIGISIPYDTRGFIAPSDFAICPDVTFLCEIDLSLQ